MTLQKQSKEKPEIVRCMGGGLSLCNADGPVIMKRRLLKREMTQLK